MSVTYLYRSPAESTTTRRIFQCLERFEAMIVKIKIKERKENEERKKLSQFSSFEEIDEQFGTFAQ